MAQQLSNEQGIPLISSQKGTREGRYSMISACFNFVNSIIGSGVIGLPYALNQAGLPFGFLLLIIVAFITDYTIILLIKGGNLSGTTSYQSLVQSTFGFPGFLVLSVLQFLYPFIAMISYNITTGDTLTKVFQRIPGVGPDHILADRHFVIVLSTVLCTLPLSLYRNIGRLGKVSFLSMILTAIIVVIVIIRAATLGPQIPPTEGAWLFAKWNAIQAVGVMSFAFICHHNSFLIYASLEKPTLTNWTRVTHVSVGSSLIISATFALAGYVTFTGYTQGDIFENYCRNDNLATFGRFCFGLSIIMTFPLECFVTREVVSSSIFGRELSKVEHMSVTVIIVAACTAVSLAYDCLGIVLELSGALSATPLIFIIPSACFIKLSPGRWYHSENLIPAMLIVLGVFVMITGLMLTVLNPQDCSHGVEMFYCRDANFSGTQAPV
ncbi:putative sodium-coupled neutral amino acid transporter 11 isoform X2 [Syngnathus typhle]|uniref:putative sodium-coupled neutral amino acid transporter 11 isoform X2 n=1 Tax=Syngnathus typhle TaxID=161592 RepID=UPI002A6AC331|nr:putative sodium-coupled neutral amino acid transporter 11 isoform X2 [Syngnathus typhle]XP_061143310.1 putative sodium-coupled neutral amino acid transporter 11 isoform X2 [Syngnathus typhle]